MRKRYFGDLTITLPDGYVEHCIIRERTLKRFMERLREAVEIILKSQPEGRVKVNYRGDYVAQIGDFLMSKKCGRPDFDIKLRGKLIY